MISNYLKGVFWIGLYAIFSMSNDSMMKSYSTSLPPEQLVFLRFLFGCISILPILYLNSRKAKDQNNELSFINSSFKKMHFIRAIILYSGMLLYTISLKHLPLAINIFGCFTIPIFVTIFAFMFLGENIKGNIMQVLLGFLGILISFYNHLNLSPQSLIYLIILISAVSLFAIMDVSNKFLINSDEGTVKIMFYTSLFTSLCSLPYALYSWTQMTPYDTGAMIWVGISGNLVFYSLLKGFSYAPISSLQPIKYIEFPLAVIAGDFFFNESINLPTIIAFCFVVLSITISMFKNKDQKEKS